MWISRRVYSILQSWCSGQWFVSFREYPPTWKNTCFCLKLWICLEKPPSPHHAAPHRARRLILLRYLLLHVFRRRGVSLLGPEILRQGPRDADFFRQIFVVKNGDFQQISPWKQGVYTPEISVWNLKRRFLSKEIPAFGHHRFQLPAVEFGEYVITRKNASRYGTYRPESGGLCCPFSKVKRIHFCKNTSWWFQPFWKILVKMDHFPRLGWK